MSVIVWALGNEFSRIMKTIVNALVIDKDTSMAGKFNVKTAKVGPVFGVKRVAIKTITNALRDTMVEIGSVKIRTTNNLDVVD